MIFVLVHDYFLLVLFLLSFSDGLDIFLTIRSIRGGVVLLGNFHLHRLIAIGADRLLVLETVQTERLVVLLADEALDFDQVRVAAEFDDLMVLALRVRNMLDLARVAEKHRVASEALELGAVLRIDHVRWTQVAKLHVGPKLDVGADRICASVQTLQLHFVSLLDSLLDGVYAGHFFILLGVRGAHQVHQVAFGALERLLVRNQVSVRVVEDDKAFLDLGHFDQVLAAVCTVAMRAGQRDQEYSLP